MSNACNTATILQPERFFAPGLPAALRAVSAQLEGVDPAPPASASACAQAAAVMDVVEALTLERGDEAAGLARTGATWGLKQAHLRHWAGRMRPGPGDRARPGLSSEATFGLHGLATPSSLEICADGNLWISGFGSERVTVLSPQGALLRHIALPEAQPWGLFASAQGQPWVCDYAKPQLTRFDLDGAVREVISVRTALPHLNLRPIFGAANGAELYLILSDAQGRNRRLARLSPGSNGQAELLPCPVAVPSAIRICGGRLIVAGQMPPAIMSRPLSGGDWTRINTGLLPDYLTGLCCQEAGLWVAARGLLARLGPGGAVEEVMDAGAKAGYPKSNLVGMAWRAQGADRLLYLVDNIHDLVHVFRQRLTLQEAGALAQHGA